MKKSYFVIAWLVICSQTILCQDLIVTKSNDSINCKITKLKKDEIYFVFKNNNEFQSTLIPLSQVSKYQYDFFVEGKIPKDSLPGFDNNPKFRIAVNGGYSYDPGKLNNSGLMGFDDYYDNLRSGYNIEGSFIYFLDEYFGLGLVYNLFQTKNSIDGVVFIEENGAESVGILADDISVSFIGPLLSIRLFNKTKKNAFIFNSSIGYLAYRNNQTLLNPIKLSGNTIGFLSEIGYDIGLTKDLSIGFQLGATSGKIRKFEVDNGVSTEKIELSNNERLQGSARLDFSIGLRYML